MNDCFFIHSYGLLTGVGRGVIWGDDDPVGAPGLDMSLPDTPIGQMVVRVSAAAAATPVSPTIVAMVVMVMVVMQVRVLAQVQCSGADAAAATAGTAARTACTRARAVRKAERRLGRRGEVLVAAPVRAGLRVEDVRMGIVHGGLGRRFTVADELRMGRLVLVVARVPAGRRRLHLTGKDPPAARAVLFGTFLPASNARCCGTICLSIAINDWQTANDSNKTAPQV
uniref:Uncharacterized protein n=1 Tax=Anopheles merus TaxID=30066 RepID=A0A182UMP5_ANOME